MYLVYYRTETAINNGFVVINENQQTLDEEQIKEEERAIQEIALMKAKNLKHCSSLKRNKYFSLTGAKEAFGRGR